MNTSIKTLMGFVIATSIQSFTYSFAQSTSPIEPSPTTPSTVSATQVMQHLTSTPPVITETPLPTLPPTPPPPAGLMLVDRYTSTDSQLAAIKAQCGEFDEGLVAVTAESLAVGIQELKRRVHDRSRQALLVLDSMHDYTINQTIDFPPGLLSDDLQLRF